MFASKWHQAWNQGLAPFRLSNNKKRSRPARRRYYRPRFESLENRALLAVFTNAASITINDRPTAVSPPGTATPFPSNIVVSGLSGTISDVNVTLTGVSHGSADDIDILLVGPNGEKFVLVSDGGGTGVAITNVTVTFDDASGTSIADTVTGWGAANAFVTSQPVNYGAVVEVSAAFPGAPASPYSQPAPSGSATLASVFNGAAPNGTWSLYVADDALGSSGSISGGWSVNITTVVAEATTTTVLSSVNPSLRNQAVTFTADVNKSSDSSPVTGGTVTFKEGATILSGPTAVDGSGQATFIAAANTLSEGSHVITAEYSGVAGTFAVSSGSVTQVVDNPTTVNGNTFCNTGNLAINEGQATPYPSHIFVTGLSGTISSVTVDLEGVTHGSLDDIDILLVGPLGQNLILVSDAGGTGTGATNVSVTFDDAAATSLPDTGGWGAANTSVTSKPVNYGSGDTFPSPAPAPSGSITLAAFNGTDPNGTWSLYVIDDAAGSIGNIVGGWCLNFTVVAAEATTTTIVSSQNPSLRDQAVTFTADVNKSSDSSPVTGGTVTFKEGATILSGPTAVDASGQATFIAAANSFSEGSHVITAEYSGVVGVFGPSSGSVTQVVDNPTAVNGNTFCNTGNLAINEGQATPYPSHIFVSGLSGTISSVTVDLEGVTHGSLDDIDILLVGPLGQNLILVSDAGGTGTGATNVSVTFDDAAATSLPDTGGWGAANSSVTSKPVNYGSGDTFPSPAPAPSGSTTLAAFNGTDPNGTWSLYVLDDALGSIGNIAGGWCLNFTLVGADLQITKDDGSLAEIPGTPVTYTITVSNAGPGDATGATVTDNFPATLTGVTYTATQSGGASGFTASGSGNINDTVDMPFGSSITYVVTGTIDPAATGTLSNTATVTTAAPDPNPANNSATDTDTLAPEADLQVTKTDGQTTAIPGTPLTYTIVVTNAGPSSISGANVADIFPATLTGVSYTATQSGGASGFTASGSGNISDTVNMPFGSSITYVVTGTIDPAATGSLSNTATVTAPAGVTDTSPGNNSTTDTDTLTPQADLQITKTDGQATAIPGTPLTYTIVVTNAGPSNVTGASVTDTFPAALTGVTYTATQLGGASGFTPSGSGNINDTVDMPFGSSITYVVTGTIDPAATGTLGNTATVTSGVFDPIPANNSATDTDALTPQADLQVTKTDGQATAVPGTSLVYTITVTNGGPSNVVSASVADAFPANLTGVTYTATQSGGASGFTASGSGNIGDTVSLPAGSSIIYVATGFINPAATGSLSNTATVSSGVTDINPANNSATDTDVLTPQADLQVTKTDGQTTAIPGTPLTYTIVVTNTGPSSVAGASVTDTFPATLSGITYTATQSGGASGFTASGSGNINDSVTMAPGSSVTYIVNGTINPAATGTLSNTATVTAPAGVTDTTPGNNSATDTDTLTPQADLQITKTDGQSTAIPGTPLTYTIVVSNTGPSSASGASVADTFPASLTSVTYTASQSGGASGFTPAGSGNISDSVTMPPGSSITYVVSATINPAATGTLSNTATVTAPAGVTDATPGNNSATDTDTLTPQADLQITKTDGQSTAIPGTPLTYTIIVSNTGPSSVTAASVTDTFPASLTGVTFTASQSGGASGFTPVGSGNIGDSVTMPPGSSITYVVSATIDPAATGTLSNTATVTAPAGATDPTPGSNSATDTDTLTPQANLQVTKTDGQATAIPGTPLTYTIIVSNSGPSNAPGATVADAFPASLTGVTFTATQSGGASGFTASGSGNISDTVSLPAGSSITYVATGFINPAATGTLSNTATVTAPAGVTDPAPGNNSATDTDTLTPQADLQVTKTDGQATAIPGTPLTYTIIVTNSGPSTAPGASVSDIFPATLTGMTYTATQSGGGSGFTASGSGNIGDTVTMPPGSSITYVATGTINPSALGVLINTASVAAPAGVTETNPGNNSATDTDILTPQADLTVTKVDSPDPVIAGTDLTYTIIVNNNGPSDALGVNLTDTIPTNTTFVSFTAPAGWSSTTPPGGGTGTVTSSNSALAAGAAATFTLVVNVNAATPDGTTISNTANIGSATTDPTPGNNSDTETTIVISLDYGDAPDSYGTLLASDGARHPLGSGLILGAFADTDADGQPSPDALGDDTDADGDDEDGTSFVAPLIPHLNAVAVVNSSGAGFVDAWVDFNGNGTFGAGEQIAASFPVVAGNNNIVFTVPASAVAGTTFARFRLSSTGGLSPTGLAADGEVEDRTVRILACPDNSVQLVADPVNPGQKILLVCGTSGNDVYVIEPRPSNLTQVRIKNTGKLIGIVNNSQFQSIAVFGKAGNDTIIVDARINKPAQLFGDTGNDQLYGAGGADRIHGGDGNDKLFGGNNNDILTGDAGNDFVYGQNGNDTLTGNDGNDQMWGEAGSDRLFGGSGNDVLAGGDGNDSVFGGADNDKVFGDGGNDIVVGENGNDLVYGGQGRDVLLGGNGADTLFGEQGDDILVAGPTSHDNNQAALQGILNEWASNHTYNARVNNIRTGGGFTGGFAFNSGTVFNDGVVDTLWGKDGQDWFLIGLGDIIKDKAANELVN